MVDVPFGQAERIGHRIGGGLGRLILQGINQGGVEGGLRDLGFQGRADQQHDLAARRTGFCIVGGEVRERTPTCFLEQFGQFPRHGSLTFAPERKRKVFDGGGKSGPALIKYQRAGHGLQRFGGCAARPALGRKEAGEHELVARQAAGHQARQHGRCTRNRENPNTSFERVMGEFPARIGYERCAGIRNQSDFCAFLHTRNEAWPPFRPIVVMVGAQPHLKAIGRHQFSGDAGVFGQHFLDAAQDIQRPKRNVSKVADWGGDNIKPGSKCLRRLPGTAAARSVARCMNCLGLGRIRR